MRTRRKCSVSERHSSSLSVSWAGESTYSTKSEKRVFLAAARERHPFLLDLHSCFQTETRIYFV